MVTNTLAFYADILIATVKSFIAVDVLFENKIFEEFLKTKIDVKRIKIYKKEKKTGQITSHLHFFLEKFKGACTIKLFTAPYRNKLERGGRYQPKSCLGTLVNSKLGRTDILHGKCMSYMQSILELKTRPRF